MAQEKVGAKLTLEGVDRAIKDAKDLSREIEKTDKALREEERAARKAMRETERGERAAATQAKELQRAIGQAASTASSMFNRMSSVTRTLGTRMMGTSHSTRRLVGGLVGVGATYMGVRMVSRAIQSIGSSAASANSSVENITLSVASLYSEIESVSFAEAQRSASGLYRQLEQLAISSPGTTQNLADMFTMAYGPMRRAGVELNRLTTFSRDAVAVASALRIDAPQVARDISMMATGAAGQDVRTFRTLRAMGMITESTEQWNQMAQRTPLQAATRMMDIFDRLGRQSAEAFGRTWTGVTSAFEDITNYFLRAISSPAFNVLRRELLRLNESMVKFRNGISKLLGGFGGRFAHAMAGVISRMRRFFLWVISNIGAIGDRIDRSIASLRRLAPMLRAMAIAAAAFKALTLVIGVAVTAFGAIFSVISTAVGLLGPALAGIGGIGTALGIGGGAAAAGTAVAGGGAAVAGGGAAALLGPIAAIVAVLAPLAIFGGMIQGLAILLPVVSSVFLGLWRNSSTLMSYLSGLGQDILTIGSNLWDFARSMYAVLSPILETLGFIIVGVVFTAFRNVVRVLVLLSGVARVLAGYYMALSGVIAPLAAQVRIFFNLLFQSIRQVSEGIVAIVRQAASLVGVQIGSLSSVPTMSAAPSQGSAFGDAFRRLRGDFMDAMRGIANPNGERGRGGRAVDARPTTNIDMRGSRINVRQEFREADPDRVMVQMRDAMASEVIHRTSSGFVPALSR